MGFWFMEKLMTWTILNGQTACSHRGNQNVYLQAHDFDKKSFCLKEYTSKKLMDEFSEKSWTKQGVSKHWMLLKKLLDTSTVDRATKRYHTTTGSFQSHPHFTKENNFAFVRLIC